MRLLSDEDSSFTQCQLIRRHWVITNDANEHSEEVDGEGVIGELPILTGAPTHQVTPLIAESCITIRKTEVACERSAVVWHTCLHDRHMLHHNTKST